MITLLQMQSLLSLRVKNFEKNGQYLAKLWTKASVSVLCRAVFKWYRINP